MMSYCSGRSTFSFTSIMPCFSPLVEKARWRKYTSVDTSLLKVLTTLPPLYRSVEPSFLVTEV